jgi:hypothetical protein
MTNPENLCATMGCPAACCQNIEFQLSRTEADRFIESQPVNHINPRNLQVFNLDEIPSIPAGFTVIEDPEEEDAIVHIYLKGPCPYLDRSSFDCLISKAKKRPGICAEVEIGHDTCDRQRHKKGLSQIRTVSLGQ